MAERPEGDLTPRERRALREKEKKKEATSLAESSRQFAKRAAIPAIVVLVIAGFAAAIYINENVIEEKCPAHDHATMHTYVDGERISFQHPQLDLNGDMRMRFHLHQSDDEVWHLEGGCTDIEKAFRELHVGLSEKQIVLEGVHEQLGQAGTYKEEGNKTLEMYLYEDGNWTKKDIGDMLGFQARDGHRILLTYGENDEEEVARMQAQVPPPPGSAPAEHDA